MRRSSLLGAALTGTLVASLASSAHAVELTKDKDPLRLDVTETTIVGQRFNLRCPFEGCDALNTPREGERFRDVGWGMWLNRLNVALRYKKWTVATRLDSSVYWLRPEDRSVPADQRDDVARDAGSRFVNSIYPSKLWASYQSKELELTIGDAYAQFGRGLILSLRKLDELGVDNTVRGVKAVVNVKPLTITALAGLGNPSRVDESTGRALFFPRALPGAPSGAPLFGTDRITGISVEAGKGLPVTLGTHAMRIDRCAPYPYRADGTIDDTFTKAPFGACGTQDTTNFLDSLPKGGNELLNANTIMAASQSISIPNLFGHGNLYVEAATQDWHADADPKAEHTNGNAIYGALSVDVGKVASTLEVKSYRNFYAIPAGVQTGRATEFNNVFYSTPPTTQVITMDSEYGFFNRCVDGGRLRSNVRTGEGMLLWAAAAYYFTKSEVDGAGCDAFGHTVTILPTVQESQSRVYEGTVGMEHSFDRDRSQLLLTFGGRNDVKLNGINEYSELYAWYTFVKQVKGPTSIELNGRHRIRYKENANRTSGADAHDEPWFEGQHYSMLKIAPKWVISQGIEYTTQQGFAPVYINANLLYRFSSESNLKVLVGEQRGGLKCVSGICRIFPSYAGARVEVTMRF